jgi:hypothetical protein
LATLGDVTVVPILESALTEQSDPQVQGAILRALYELGARPLEALLPLLRDEDFLIRFQLLDGLEHDVRPEDRQTAIDALQELLSREKHAGVRGDAEVVLRKLIHAHTGGDTAPAQAGTS